MVVMLYFLPITIIVIYVDACGKKKRIHCECIRKEKKKNRIHCGCIWKEKKIEAYLTDVVLKGRLRRLCAGKGRIINSEPVSSSNNNVLLLSNNCGLVSSPNNCGFVSLPNNCDLVSSPNNRGLVSLPQNPVSLHNNNGSYTILSSNNYNNSHGCI